ncbi:alpha/beta hydrolase family protein [Amycolatopsis regifaucium]|uniref:Chlorophyllase n=1 Tax=Amycolatopsis regifaucium TaxID=546365 RepID=A0A154M3H9_9PSEU|nr:alpha/beta fold hydrolase [Amycolatopsis regifaucium]KZB79148.1 chlorophyllase [Amycolatopsis regifaucium]OKA07332.1 chlorophyllase [Amycolatopsis regifaucium]SFH14134.1 Alpha/beta hydrolase family protein [Amycolatopsis regifaucium]
MSISTLAPAPVLSVSPVVLPTPDRAVDLQVRVSAPMTGDELPIVLLSHGQGYSNHLSSLNGYAPLVNFWAAQGFAVLQPTHLSSRTLNLGSDDPEAPMYYRSRAEDMIRILDRLDEVEAAVPQLRGRLDRGKVAVAGHSMGGHTASLLLGARYTDPHTCTEVNLAEPRISAGVLLAAPGRGGDAVTEFVAENYSFFLSTDFSAMTTPALVVAGDKDASTHLTVRGPEWHADPYFLSPGRKTLLTLFGAEHGLGGISGFDVAETTDENPERVAAVTRLTSAYLRSEFSPGDPAWRRACEELTSGVDPLGRVEAK